VISGVDGLRGYIGVAAGDFSSGGVGVDLGLVGARERLSACIVNSPT